MNVRPEISTTAGTVRGRWDNAVAVFRGIPYAEPPVGARRFAAPVAAKPWEGVREALAFGPPVPSAGRATSGVDADSGNCLTLNVWTPDLGAAGLPVLVWIHGGKYLEGTSANPHNDGATLAGSGAVVISMNYRVGLEGFAHITGAPDNRGILDQAAALRWVRDNVAAFGGDPGNVTVFGQSAGAGCIAALLAMPSAVGQFRRAIVQSLPGTFFSRRLAAAVSATIAAELGVRATVDELAGIPPRTLIGATDALIRKMPDFAGAWALPTPRASLVSIPRTPLRPVAISHAPTSPRDGSTQRSHCTKRYLATITARWAQIIRTRSPLVTTSPAPWSPRGESRTRSRSTKSLLRNVFASSAQIVLTH